MNQKEITRYFAKFGKQGGEARARKLTAEQRKESARRAAQARWGNRGEESMTNASKAAAKARTRKAKERKAKKRESA